MSTALVTGGTSGIGAAFCRTLAARGYNLVLVARDADRLTAMASELTRDHAIGVEILVADLGRRDDVLTVADRVADAERPIDVLVNNAGYGVQTRLLDPDIAAHEYALDVMCRAVMILSGAAGRAMKQRGHGWIINVASLTAWITQGHYSPVKAYVLTYTESLACELHDTGVQVTALCPGWVRTEFHQRARIKTSMIPRFIWVDPDRCVAECLDDVRRGKVISVPTKRWKFARFFLRHLPRSLVRWGSRMLTNSRD